MSDTYSIAIISFIDPTYGYAGGATKYVENSCNVLAEAGFRIDFYAFHNRNEKRNALKFADGVNIAGQYCTSVNPFLFLRKYPFCVERRQAKRISQVNWSKYDLVLFEGEQVYCIYRILKKKIKTSLIRMHDIESAYRREIASSQRGVRKLLNCLESCKFKKIEQELSDDDSYFGFVSSDELAEFKKTYKGTEDHLIYLPPFYTYRGLQAPAGRESYLIFFGDLSLQNNYFSIKWYLENCFKPARNAVNGLTIHICGKTTCQQKHDLESICGGVFAKGFVNNLREEIEKARFVVCPILYGAGVKIKLFEALSYGKLVLANTKALEGTFFENGKHLVVVNGSEQFTSETIRLSQTQNLPDYSGNLQDIFTRLYSPDVFLKTFESVLSLRK